MLRIDSCLFTGCIHDLDKTGLEARQQLSFDRKERDVIGFGIEICLQIQLLNCADQNCQLIDPAAAMFTPLTMLAGTPSAAVAWKRPERPR